MKAIVLLFYTKFNGASNIVVSDRVVSLMKADGYTINDASFRAYLGVIRYNDSCSKYLKKYEGRVQHAFIVSNNEGYWWTEDIEEMKTFWESQLKRVQKTMSNVKPLYKLLGYSDEQMKLFFPEEKGAA